MLGVRVDLELELGLVKVRFSVKIIIRIKTSPWKSAKFLRLSIIR